MPGPSSTITTDKGIKEPTTDEVPTIDELIQIPIDQLVKEYGRFPLFLDLSLLIDEALHKSFPSHLKGQLSYFKRIEGYMRKHVVDGDYICYSIVLVCEILRSKDPIFRKRSSIAIAENIMYRFPKSDMVEELKLHDVGFLSFKLNGDWMAKRIRKNLKDGIAAWAPILPAKRAIVDFPEQDIDADQHADGVRSTYIRDLLVRMLEYSGVEVCRKICNERSLQIVRKDFPEVGGLIRNKRNDSLFEKKKATLEPQTNNVHEDLAALWCGTYEQKANWIVYVIPVRQRDYILKCFNAVKEDHNSMCFLGYQTSCDENEKLASLWGAFDAVRPDLASGLTAGSPLSYRKSESGLASSLTARPYFQRAFESGKAFGYTPVAVIECTIRYEYLKKYAYCGCTFEYEEMFGLEGNNFINLLDTRDKIRRVLENSRHPNLDSNQVLAGKEREFGLHLLRFTEIIHECIMYLKPHLLCEYLYNLSKNFTSFFHQIERSETLVLLYKAAEVVLEKGFDLLGISMESLEITYLKQQNGKSMAMDHYVASPVLSQNLSSRFEMFNMTVGVLDSNFTNANLFGDIRVSDTYGVHPDKWCDNDMKGCGEVAYFDHNWYDSLGIRCTSFSPIPFGDPASCVSVPFSNSIKIIAHLWVSSEKKNVVYQLCNVEGEIKLEDFWKGDQKIKRNTFHVDGENGCINFYYYLIKEAVDTSISLKYEPIVGQPRPLRGYIHAYYGGGALDSCHGYNKEYYKAYIFNTGPTKLVKGDLKLNKSTLAVPKNGILMIEAFFEDVDTGEHIVKETHDYNEEHEGKKTECIIGDVTCRFILTVDWIRPDC